MSLGPIELVVIGFPETPSSGRIASEIQDLIDREVITLVDGLFVTKETDGGLSLIEIEQVDADESIRALAAMLDDSEGLLNDEDAYEIAKDLPPGASALMLVFENTWVKPVRDAIFDSDGVLLSQVRIPGRVVDQVMEALG